MAPTKSDTDIVHDKRMETTRSSEDEFSEGVVIRDVDSWGEQNVTRFHNAKDLNAFLQMGSAETSDSIEVRLIIVLKASWATEPLEDRYNNLFPRLNPGNKASLLGEHLEHIAFESYRTFHVADYDEPVHFTTWEFQFDYLSAPHAELRREDGHPHKGMSEVETRQMSVKCSKICRKEEVAEVWRNGSNAASLEAASPLPQADDTPASPHYVMMLFQSHPDPDVANWTMTAAGEKDFGVHYQTRVIEDVFE